MLRQDVARMINEVFEESFEIDPALLQPDAQIFDDLGLDSLDVVDLIVALQKKFEVRVRKDDPRIANVRSLGDICDFIFSVRDEHSSGLHRQS